MTQAHVWVWQRPQLAACDLRELAHFLPERPQWLFDGAVLRLPVPADFVVPPAAAAALQAQEIDYAVLPDKAFGDLGLLVSDMDSTLITIECIDEIAAGAGLKAEVAAVTERAMRGELDFVQSLRQRVALLRGLPENILQQVYEQVLRLSPGAEYLLAECRRHDVCFLLVSGGFDYFTDRLQRDWGLDYAHANTLEVVDGRLTGKVIGRVVDARAKADLLEQYRLRLGLRPEQVLAMGDGANDIPMLQAAGIGVAYHAKPKTQAVAMAAVRFGGLETVRRWFRP